MKISKEKINQIIELKNQGKTFKEIKDITGCCKNTCIKYLKATNNYETVKVIEITPELLEKIQQRYDEVGSIKKVAADISVATFFLIFIQHAA